MASHEEAKRLLHGALEDSTGVNSRIRTRTPSRDERQGSSIYLSPSRRQSVFKGLNPLRRGSKLMNFLGSGLLGMSDEDQSPLNLGYLTINVTKDEEPTVPYHFGTAPINHLSPTTSFNLSEIQWTMNYKEAAIYLEEGENNDQFCTHPKRKESLAAYVSAHTNWVHVLDMVASFVLLALAAIEVPAIPSLQVPRSFHASVELGALGIIAFGLILKLRWLGMSSLLTHRRTTFKAITLLVMTVEALIVFARNTTHFRITRALRPIFLMDNKFCRGIRRFTREILRSLQPISDMLILLFFLMLLFTLLGHFLFGKDPNNPYFRTIDESFLNLFILLTTANYPDVMMPAYYRSRWNVLFFILYLVVMLYLFMNFLLAVVYETFTTLEKEKFRKLVIHKRKACHFAFNLLISKSNPCGVIFRHFCGMMRQFQPNKSFRDVYLTFRALDKSQDGILTREEFSKFYDVAHLSWKPKPQLSSQTKWNSSCRGCSLLLERFMNHEYSDHLFNAVIVMNVACMLTKWLSIEDALWPIDSYVFAIWFILEMSLKVWAWGPNRLLTSGWHLFDLIASLSFLSTVILVHWLPSMEELLTFVRPLRLLRLFKLKKRYRNLLGTLFILLRPMSSMCLVMLSLYYFFAIIGMEVFYQIPLRNCCKGTSLEAYYVDPGPPLLNATSNNSVPLRYYINTFDNILASGVTLFELTVVNNWYVIMEGHAHVTSRYSRIFFMTFYIVTMIFLNVIVAFILDSFLFRMRYKREISKKTESSMLRTEGSLNAEEIEFCYKDIFQDPKRRAEILKKYSESLALRGYVTYEGWRKRTKEVLLKRVFQDEITDWLEESEPILAMNLRSSHREHI